MTIKDFPTGKHDIIAIDPPWNYTLRETDPTHRNKIPYKSLSNEDIKSLPIQSIAKEDAYLFLWATKDHLQLAQECISLWGFNYKNIFPWIKITKKGTPHMGAGHWGRNVSEFFIIAARGKAKPLSSLGIRDMPAVIMARRQDHSRKPEDSFLIMERLADKLDNPSKIELFARSPRPGWVGWGDEYSEETDLTA